VSITDRGWYINAYTNVGEPWGYLTIGIAMENPKPYSLIAAT